MGDQETWDAVDRYVGEHLVGEDDVLEAALAESESNGLPAIAVSPAQGKLLCLTARSIGAGRILEIGTLGGYSTIWLARALPDGGSLISLELSDKHATVARRNIDRAGLSAKVEVRVGPAMDSLEQLSEAFDLVFIDADKANIPRYFEHSLRLSHPGTVIITDNTVRNGAVADPDTDDVNVKGVRALHEMLAGRPDVDSTTIQTVGAKGYDGFTFSLVR
jgi:predicted O-methyltransferase YrrM